MTHFVKLCVVHCTGSRCALELGISDQHSSCCQMYRNSGLQGYLDPVQWESCSHKPMTLCWFVHTYMYKANWVCSNMVLDMFWSGTCKVITCSAECSLIMGNLTLRSISDWSRPARSLGSLTVISLKRRSRSEVCLVLVAASVGEGAAGSCPTRVRQHLSEWPKNITLLEFSIL